MQREGREEKREGIARDKEESKGSGWDPPVFGQYSPTVERESN